MRKNKKKRKSLHFFLLKSLDFKCIKKSFEHESLELRSGVACELQSKLN